MRVRRILVTVLVMLALAAAAGAVWTTFGSRGQAADPRAQGLSLLEAVAREVHTKFIQPTVDDATLYDGARKGVLETSGPACTRVVGEVAPPVTSGPPRIAALVDAVEQRCTPQPDVRGLYFGAAKGMLAALGDPYTRFMDPRAFEEFRQDSRGFFFGIGIFIDLKDQHLIVVQPIPGTPAARAGLRAGDRIKDIEGAPTAGMALQEAVVRIRGPQGTRVTLGIERGDRAFTTTIVRDRIEIVAAEGGESLDASTQATLQQAGIGYIKLVTFNDNTEKMFASALKAAIQGGARALILDLRNNGGGLLDVSLQVVNHFVPAGQVRVYTVDREGRKEADRATTGVAKVTLPVVVLVNEFTASASEIVSGALQDHHVATLVGVKTFGKGVIQTIVDLPLGSGAAITTAKYLTPLEHDIHGKGLQPNEVVGETQEAISQRLRGQPDDSVEKQVQQMRATQLARAIEMLKKKLGRSFRHLPVTSAAVFATAA
jgi:carboxyl-terminal processing protease